MKKTKPITLILVRHGNTFEKGETPKQVGSRTDLPLTADGRKQAEDVALYLASKHQTPNAIYAGMLKRQTETAQIIGKILKVEDCIHLNEPALNEVDYGLWEGLTADEIASRWPNEYANWAETSQWGHGIFGGDFNQLMRGIRKWIEVIKDSYHPGDTVIGVTSNGIIRFFYSFLPLEWNRQIEGRKMEDLKVKTGHFCELLLFQDEVQVKNWNKAPKK